ncbi:hypothetical protein J5N97_021323 [Dioscorea zingiberensis]|uniref:Uncharacterized protein n=1 Tax=Dioscorea zingiberensis TaxID=325984 RepID=A0A9D5CI92_9LILI|nr:hypothetical protein J5N97_021323 [Dioscorea zingiberensis]
MHPPTSDLGSVGQPAVSLMIETIGGNAIEQNICDTHPACPNASASEDFSGCIKRILPSEVDNEHKCPTIQTYLLIRSKHWRNRNKVFQQKVNGGAGSGGFAEQGEEAGEDLVLDVDDDEAAGGASVDLEVGSLALDAPEMAVNVEDPAAKEVLEMVDEVGALGVVVAT